jgi:two-component system, LytTR family, response regulator
MENGDFFLKENKRMVKIAINEIVYIESYKDYMCFHSKDRSVKVRIPLWSIEERLDNHNFIRVHKSFIVSVNFIDSYSTTFIEVKGNRIPIGRTYKKDVSAFLTKHFLTNQPYC